MGLGGSASLLPRLFSFCLTIDCLERQPIIPLVSLPNWLNFQSNNYFCLPSKPNIELLTKTSQFLLLSLLTLLCFFLFWLRFAFAQLSLAQVSSSLLYLRLASS